MAITAQEMDRFAEENIEFIMKRRPFLRTKTSVIRYVLHKVVSDMKDMEKQLDAMAKEEESNDV